MDWLQHILVPVLTALGTALAGVVTYTIMRFAQWLAGKTNNEALQAAIQEIADAVGNAVRYVNQTFTDQLKKDNKFDAAAQKEALNRALTTTMENISKDAKKTLDKHGINIGKYILTLIEDTINNINRWER